MKKLNEKEKKYIMSFHKHLLGKSKHLIQKQNNLFLIYLFSIN
jgi:hypothetical protein